MQKCATIYQVHKLVLCGIATPVSWYIHVHSVLIFLPQKINFWGTKVTCKYNYLTGAQAFIWASKWGIIMSITCIKSKPKGFISGIHFLSFPFFIINFLILFHTFESVDWCNKKGCVWWSNECWQNWWGRKFLSKGFVTWQTMLNLFSNIHHTLQYEEIRQNLTLKSWWDASTCRLPIFHHLLTLIFDPKIIKKMLNTAPVRPKKKLFGSGYGAEKFRVGR